MLCTSINGTDGSLITSLLGNKTAQAASLFRYDIKSVYRLERQGTQAKIL